MSNELRSISAEDTVAMFNAMEVVNVMRQKWPNDK